ncbi:MAG TPA: hypothetical protein VFP59_17870 [Candidatus Angelobacter sp.]|nr:hypothetical protein [Candidatus Angelobacter sp.]
MANASTQVQALEQLQSAAQRSLPVQRLMNLTEEINSGRPAQGSGISVGQGVVQRELYVRKGFIEPEPEVTEDYETLMQHDTWEFLRQGLEMFTAAAGDFLETIKQIANVVLTLSTSTEIDSIGKTTLKLIDPTGRVRTSEGGQHNSATIQQWSPWLGDPATRVGIVVQVNPNRVFDAATVAQTLNHEVFLYAVEILGEIKRLKSIKGDKEREEFALQHGANPDQDHADFVFGRRKDLIVHQARMIANALRDHPVRAQQLVDDYRRDWSDRREEMLKAAAGKLWDGDERELRKYATGIIEQFKNSSDRDVEAEVADMRNIFSIIDYDFDTHLADVWRRHKINLQPRIEKPGAKKPEQKKPEGKEVASPSFQSGKKGK